MEDGLKIFKVEYICNHCMERDIWVLRGKLKENSGEILSVALLSSACSLNIVSLFLVTYGASCGFYVYSYAQHIYTYGWYSPGGDSTQKMLLFSSKLMTLWPSGDIILNPYDKIFKANFKWDSLKQSEPKKWPWGP
jgi:hypothetical protein